MNKRIIVFGCFLAVFLMLMIPIKPAVENQNKQNIIEIDSFNKSINYTNLKNIINQIPKDEIIKQIREKYPGVTFYKNLFTSLKELSMFNEWYYLSNYSNYAPSGLPDFSQLQQVDWRDVNGHASLCGAVCLADIFWWFDSMHEDLYGYPGDGNDSYPLVKNYLKTGLPIPGPNSDDHNFNNVNDADTKWNRSQRDGELIEQIAWYTNRQKDTRFYQKLGVLTPLLDIFNLFYGIKKWLLECNLQQDYSVKVIFRPSFSTIMKYINNNAGIILGIGVYDDNMQKFQWGHFVAVAGINPKGFIALSDPLFDVEKPSNNDYEHNDANITSHDGYKVNLTSPSPIASWWIPDYFTNGALIIDAFILSEIDKS